MSAKIVAIAYPELNATDFDHIESHRRLNDDLFSVVKPHFTLVFPVVDFPAADFIQEINRQIVGVNSFDFCLRCATISKDSFSDNYLVFLIPDDGYSHLVKLHDKLYSHKLFGHLRLDLDYIPHIRVGNFVDKMQCKKMVDEWNRNDFAIRGTISTIDVVSYNNEMVTTIQQIQLKKAK